MKIQFLNKVNPLLKEFIRHYWYVNGEERESFNQNLLLPMDHVDLIITMGNSFIYGENERMCQPESIHFHGIRERSLQITQRGKIKALGISFTPWGFYFIAKQSMSQYVNRIVNLSYVNHSLWEEMSDYMMEYEGPSELIKAIENSLINCINIKYREEIDFRIIEEFIESDYINIEMFCRDNGITTRKLERIFRKYVGISPKRFMNVVRFEESVRDVMYDNESNLTDISYKHGYCDQPHFTKVFKGYTDYAPRDFQSDKPALKEHFDYGKKKKEGQGRTCKNVLRRN